jgi:ParB family chromosome partitioning protein
MAEECIYDVSIKDIEIADTNVRQTEQEKEIEELAASIKKHGLLQPVVLLGDYGRPTYELIVGQRRFLAHKKLGKKTIRATFAGKLDETQATIRSLVENMQRVELNHADTAAAITKLYKKLGRDEHKVHLETGLSLKRIRQYIDIEERATPDMKEQLRKGKVKPVDVQRVLRASGGDSEKAERLLKRVKELTTYQKERLVEYGEAHPRAAADKLLEEAKKPKVERTIMVKLSDRVRTGLEKASKEMYMNPDEVAAQALEEWLSKKGFISD